MTQTERKRAAFPLIAAVTDEFREVFGPDVKLLYAAENGRELGKQPEAGKPVCAADMVVEPKKEKGLP